MYLCSSSKDRRLPLCTLTLLSLCLLRVQLAITANNSITILLSNHNGSAYKIAVMLHSVTLAVCTCSPKAVMWWHSSKCTCLSSQSAWLDFHEELKKKIRQADLLIQVIEPVLAVFLSVLEQTFCKANAHSKPSHPEYSVL